MSEVKTAEPDTDLLEQARKQVEKKRDFKTHLFIYLLVNAALTGIWAIATPDALFWPIFPILGWGIGVVANAWDVFARKPITDDTPTASQPSAATRRSRRRRSGRWSCSSARSHEPFSPHRALGS